MDTSVFPLPFAVLTSMIPACVVAIADIPGPWLQLGLGGGCLWILWTVLSAQGKRQVKADERRAVADDRIAEAMARHAESAAANTEIQRGLLSKVDSTASEQARLAEAVTNLVVSLEARHPTPHRGREPG